MADLMIGAALFNVRQTGLDKQPAVQEKLSQLAVYREGINAHLTAAIATAERSPGGLLMPNQSLLLTGRVHACSNLPAMMHVARELCGGQICVTPDVASFRHPETGKKALYVNRNFTQRIKGLDRDESQAILEYLFKHTTRAYYQFRIDYEPGTIAIWDNRCVLHSPCPDYDVSEERLMERVTVLSDTRPVQ
jgi:aromatic ring hydroxylase